MRHPVIQRKKSWFYSPIVAIVLVIFIIWGSFGVVRAYIKQREAVAFRDQYSTELDELKTKHQELGLKIDDLSTERGLEEEVRNRYRVVKPGEKLVVIVDNDDPEEGFNDKVFWKKLRAFVGL